MKEFVKLMVVGVAYGIGVSIPMIAAFAVKAANDEKQSHKHYEEEK